MHVAEASLSCLSASTADLSTDFCSVQLEAEDNGTGREDAPNIHRFITSNGKTATSGSRMEGFFFYFLHLTSAFLSV